MTMTTYDETAPAPEATRRPLVRWGPSFAGAISAIAVTTMIMSLWLAIGYGSNVTWFVDNMHWFFLGTALFGLLVGGMVSGIVASVRGVSVGTFDGLTVWGLVLVAALIPLSLRTLALANAGASSPATRTALGVSSGDLWALFGALVGGMICAIVGGMMFGNRAVRGSASDRRPASEPYYEDERRYATAPRYERRPYDGAAPERRPGERRVG